MLTTNPTRPPARILVVDDDPVICDMCAEMLADAGYRVTTAGDGQAALDSLQGTPVDLVLMDLMMPVMDGLTACVALQADPRTRTIPIVIISAALHLMAARGAEIADMVVAVIQKPFDLDDLLLTVQQVIDHERS
jgi:two-component system response regulator MprA